MYRGRRRVGPSIRESGHLKTSVEERGVWTGVRWNPGVPTVEDDNP